MKKVAVFLALSLATSLLGAARADPPAHAAELLPLPFDWYPESLAVSEQGVFYVGSWRQGAVARIRPGETRPEILVPPGSNGLSNGQGMLVDSAHGLLWVCSGTMGFTTVPTTPSALKSYDIESGAPRGSYALPEAGYCNDLAQDERGRLYVTDSLHPRILRFEAGAGKLVIWKESPVFSTGDRYFLNGIAIDAQQRLYVSPVMAKPYLLRLPIDAQGKPGDVTKVSAPRTLKNADAIRTLSGDRLLIFESNAFGHNGPYGGTVSVAQVTGDRLTRLSSVVAGLNDPSSGVVYGERIYFIESKYGLLLAHPHDDAAIPRNVPFVVQSRPLPR
jgi:sugar lactone lactonase YvrE